MESFDPAYETTRVADEDAFHRKMKRKRTLSRLLGEVYVGKRVKLVYFRQWIDEIALPSNSKILEVGSGDGVFSFELAKTRRGRHGSRHGAQPHRSPRLPANRRRRRTAQSPLQARPTVRSPVVGGIRSAVLPRRVGAHS